MIEKLQKGEFREPVIAAKINEIIDKFNEFRSQLEPLQANVDSEGNVTWSVRPEPIGTKMTEELTEGLKES